MNPYSNNPMNRMNNYGPGPMQAGGMPAGMQGYGHVNPMNQMRGMHPSMQHPMQNPSTMNHHMRNQYMVSNKYFYFIFGDKQKP